MRNDCLIPFYFCRMHPVQSIESSALLLNKLPSCETGSSEGHPFVRRASSLFSRQIYFRSRLSLSHGIDEYLNINGRYHRHKLFANIAKIFSYLNIRIARFINERYQCAI